MRRYTPRKFYRFGVLAVLAVIFERLGTLIGLAGILTVIHSDVMHFDHYSFWIAACALLGLLVCEGLSFIFRYLWIVRHPEQAKKIRML